jgi:hypothetical protein
MMLNPQHFERLLFDHFATELPLRPDRISSFHLPVDSKDCVKNIKGLQIATSFESPLKFSYSKVDVR